VEFRLEPSTMSSAGDARPAPAPGPVSPARYGAPTGGRAAVVGALLVIAVFGFSFTAGGAFALWMAVGKIAAHTANAWVMLPIGSAFLLIGVGFLIALVRGPRAIQADTERATQFPDAPWKWRTDWAQGYAEDETKHAFSSALIFAVLWNLISAPAGVIAWQKGVIEDQHMALLAFLFPLAGLWLIASAAREGMRLAKFRRSRLDLDAVPVPVGRTLSGTVRTHLTTPPPGGFHVTLSAVRTERAGSGSSESTWTRLLWQDEADVPGHLAADTDAAGPCVVLPVVFRVPAEAESTDHHDHANEVAWRLDVQAKEPGVDFRALFAVPVYRTADSERPESAANATHLRSMLSPEFSVPDAAQLAASPRPTPASSVSVATDGDALVVDYPAARNRGAAFGLTAFATLWTGFFVLLLRLHAPAIFPIVWAFFDAILTYGVLASWLAVTRVRVDASGVSIANGFGQPGAPQVVPRTDIEDVKIAIGMTAGSTAYYDVKVVKKSGFALTAGGGLRHKAEAEWIAARMMAALGTATRG
jgi:hypothetical protein